MMISKQASRQRDQEGQCDARDEEDARLLLGALKELLDRLSDGGAPGPGSAAIEEWEGGGYFYLEAPLPGSCFIRRLLWISLNSR